MSTFVLIPVVLIPVACLSIYLFAKAESPTTNDGNAADTAGIVLLPSTFEPSAEFHAYWHGGEAEITSYKLDQARYGEMHPGTAVLMFVAEDFSTKELTKSDGKNGPKLPVLKCNFEKKFTTGIYPYSILLTVASPLDVAKYPNALKVATSSQEWCGHTYTQFNLDGKGYQTAFHSYFPGEGDQQFRLPGAFCEDAVWTRLRIDPSLLPLGEFDMIPGTIHARLNHLKFDPIRARAAMEPAADAPGQKTYTLRYPEDSRILKIWFEEKFPYVIQAWEETYVDGWGEDAKLLTTRATKIETLKLDYWNHHKNTDLPLRGKLGLPQTE